jgi:leader peptidase (prepilin peptidase)/N-methyltransferase
MEIPLFVIFTLLGLALGSFLNVLIDRLPVGKSLVRPPSHCDACEHKLSFFDLMPVLSYLILRGRCRYCQAHIPLRVLWVEVGSGLIFFLSYWRFVAYPPAGFEPNYIQFAITALWCCVFLAIIFIDWEHKLILNRITYPAVLAALVILGIDTISPEWSVLTYIKYHWPESGVLNIDILNGIIAGAIGFAFFFIIFVINPRGMGMGDIKLAFLIGIVTGFPLVVVALLIGILVGGLAAIVFILLMKKGRKDVIPYGTFLAIGPVVTLLWGNKILDWYLSLF